MKQTHSQARKIKKKLIKVRLQNPLRRSGHDGTFMVTHLESS
jgi:hypothetical protein